MLSIFNFQRYHSQAHGYDKAGILASQVLVDDVRGQILKTTADTSNLEVAFDLRTKNGQTITSVDACRTGPKWTVLQTEHWDTRPTSLTTKHVGKRPKIKSFLALHSILVVVLQIASSSISNRFRCPLD